MATLKLTIDTRRLYNDGRVPVIFRLSQNSKSTNVYTSIKILPSEWDQVKNLVNKNHPDFKNINFHLKRKLVALEKNLLEIESQDRKLTLLELKALLVWGKSFKQTTFWDFAQKEIHALKLQERYGNAQAYETAVNRLVGFTGKDITLDKIDYSVISDFDLHLKSEGMKVNAIAAYMRAIRTLINKAIKRKLIESPSYPFADFKIKTEKTVSRALVQADLVKIKSLHLEENSEMWHSRNFFFLIYNLIGISFIDLVLLEQSSIQGERVVYKRRKTGKIYSIKLTSEAKRIFSIYRKENGKFLIPYFRMDGVPKHKEKTEIALRITTCNKYLKRIGGLCELPILLTSYVARYTWANVAKTLGFPKDQIAEALGHEYGNRITGIYLDNYGSEVIDDMNEKVTGK
jgi:integrase/recombinase XerD